MSYNNTNSICGIPVQIRARAARHLIKSYEALALRAAVLLAAIVSQSASAVVPASCSNAVRQLTAVEASAAGVAVTAEMSERPGCQWLNVLAPTTFDGRVGGDADLAMFSGKDLLAFASIRGGVNDLGTYSNAFQVCSSIDRLVVTLSYGPWCDSSSVKVQLVRSQVEWKLSDHLE